MMTDNSTMTELNSPSDPNEGAGKGTVFFERARTVASTGDFDYAIEMYIQGLYREPLNLDEHKNLREVISDTSNLFFNARMVFRVGAG